MKLPAGKYWIGDPCYVFDDSGVEFDWMEFCNFGFKNDPTGRSNEGVVNHQDIVFAFHSTAYGDGCYADQFGNEYGVDAGMIGCIPYAVVTPHFDDKSLNQLGHIHSFRLPFSTGYRNGVIRFGEIRIRTT